MQQTDIRPAEPMWGVGLSKEEHRAIADAVGNGFRLDTVDPAKDLPETPAETAWIPWRVWRMLEESERVEFHALEATQRILLQDESDEDVEIEEVLEQGFLTVVRHPLTRSKVRDALFRAKEVSSLYGDIYRMTREIFLERELLTRKTDQLTFLNKILEGATSSLDPAVILERARQDLCMLLPVHLLMAAFFTGQDDEGRGQIRLFLPRLTTSAEEAWTGFLLDQAVSSGFGPVDGFRRDAVEPGALPVSLTPADGRTVVLPLKSGPDTYGCLALLCEDNVRLAKDQVQTLRAAVSHLSLALNNALIHNAVKNRADHDGLTRLHNRRSFDEHLAQELTRCRRYGHELSLLMLDLDHFKQVNDQYGHSAGDLVLTELSQLLLSTLRASDFAARFGGEEFAVLLPHTGPEHAHILAERIRAELADRVFEHKGQRFSVTVSIGVSSLSGSALACSEDLVLRADQALYAAKGNGRNAVVAEINGAEVQDNQAQATQH